MQFLFTIFLQLLQSCVEWFVNVLRGKKRETHKTSIDQWAGDIIVSDVGRDDGRI